MEARPTWGGFFPPASRKGARSYNASFATRPREPAR
jgi:hypothetical protein